MANISAYFFSLIFHIGIFLLLIFGFEFKSPLPVLENSHQVDVISASILGDTPKSKILPKAEITPPLLKAPEKPIEVPKKEIAPVEKKEIISLKIVKKIKKPD